MLPRSSEPMDAHDRDEFMFGQCAALAAAHQAAYPHLAFGIHWQRLSEDERETLMIEDGYEPHQVPLYQVQHVFTHDDRFAYDAEGAHPLPFEGWDRTTLNHSFEEVEDTGMVEYGYIPDPAFVARFMPTPPHQETSV